jgi:hypothetical protein
MAAKIKYTIVPRDILEDAIYESGVALTENALVIEPIIVFNSTMDIGIEQDIYNNEIPELELISDNCYLADKINSIYNLFYT